MQSSAIRPGSLSAWAAWAFAALGVVLTFVGWGRLEHVDSYPVLALLALVLGSSVAIGATTQRPEAFAAPLAIIVAGGIADGTWVGFVVVVLGGGTLLGLGTGMAWVLARGIPRAAQPILAVSLALAVFGSVPVLAYEISYATASELPQSVQAKLPRDGAHTSLCQNDRNANERGVSQDGVLIRELKARPDDLVSVRFIDGDGHVDNVDIRVRDMAEEELKYLEARGPDCRPKIQQALRDELG